MKTHTHKNILHLVGFSTIQFDVLVTPNGGARLNESVQ